MRALGHRQAGRRAGVARVGTFMVVSDGRAGAGAAEVAFREGGPFLVGRGPWLTHMMEAAEGRTPSLATTTGNAHHRALRGRAGQA